MADFDVPPAARGPGQVRGAGAAGPVAGVIRDLLRVADRAAGQQPVPATALLAGPDRDPGPVVVPRAVRPGPGRDPLPGPRGHGGDQRICAPLTLRHGHRVAAPDGHHVGHVLAFQPRLQVLGLPVGLIGSEPRERHPGRDRPGDHRLRLPRLGRELHVVRDARRPAPLRVIGPGLRQIQLPVDQRVPVRRGIEAKNTPTWQFSVRPAVPEYCLCTPADRVPFFRKPVSSMISTPSRSPSCPIT